MGICKGTWYASKNGFKHLAMNLYFKKDLGKEIREVLVKCMQKINNKVNLNPKRGICVSKDQYVSVL